MLSHTQPCLVLLVSLCAWCCAAIGCSRGEQLLEVRGAVTYAGEPLTTGIVSLRAKNPEVTLHQPTGVVDQRGEYRIYTNYRPGAPPGEYRVVVFATEPTIDTGKVSPGMPKSLIPKRYNDAATTPLEFEVQSQPASGAYDLRLELEMP